jgi:hypothetical protein
MATFGQAQAVRGQAQDKAEVWNNRVSDKAVDPQTRRTVSRGHSKI